MVLEQDWSLRIKRDNVYAKLKRLQSALETAQAVLNATEDDIKSNKQLLQDVKEYGVIPKEGETRTTPKLELREKVANCKEERLQRVQEVSDAEKAVEVAEKEVERVNDEIEQEEARMLDGEEKEKEKRLSKFSSSSDEKKESKLSSVESKRESKALLSKQ